jgi:hypothetical protein
MERDPNNGMLDNLESSRWPTASSDRGTDHPDAMVPPLPTHDEIARRAFEIFEDSGRQPGRCQRNWRQAEDELFGLVAGLEPDVTALPLSSPPAGPAAMPCNNDSKPPQERRINSSQRPFGVTQRQVLPR